jgi:hypothetical protein
MCEQRRKIWVFTCSCTFMLSREVSTRQYLRSTDALGRSAAERTPRPAGPGQVRGSGVDSGARDGTEAHRPRAGVKVDETRSSHLALRSPCAPRGADPDAGDRGPGETRGARREFGGLNTSINTRRTAHSVRTGGSAADAHRCYSFRFRGRQVSRRGGRSPCSSQRRARNPHGRWGRRVARAHLVTARPCPRRKPGHQRLSEVVS